MASRPFQFCKGERSQIKKSAAKHFEGLAALSARSAGRRAAVKAGYKTVHFSLDGCPLSRWMGGQGGKSLKVLGRTLFNLEAFFPSKLKWAGSHFVAFPP